jgi:hypothetical protein
MSEIVRIPADVDREDRILAGLTARQLLILAAAAALLYGAWSATRAFVPPAAFAVVAAPVAVAAAVLALGRRDGVSLDRLALAAARWRAAPRLRVCAPEGLRPAPAWLAAHATPVDGGGRVPNPVPLRLPAEDVTGTGVVDLGADGLAVVAVCSTVNFALRTPAEQDGLVAVFGRYLHSLTAPVQILVRAERLDLTGAITELRDRAPALPHPALEQAAGEHADYLAQLAAQADLLRRRVLLVLREPVGEAGPAGGLGGSSPLAALTARRRAGHSARRVGDAARRAAETRLARRVAEAAELLAPAGVVVTALGAGQATAVLAAACNPAGLLPPSAAFAAPHDVIITTTDGAGGDDDRDDHNGGPAAGWAPDTGPAGRATPGAGWDDEPGGRWGDES